MTILRALLQLNKGRDLFDLAQGLAVFEALDTGRVVDLFVQYLEAEKQTISRGEAEARMFAKLAKPEFIREIVPREQKTEPPIYPGRFSRAAQWQRNSDLRYSTIRWTPGLQHSGG